MSLSDDMIKAPQNPVPQQAMNSLLDQSFIAFVKREGGTLMLTCAEIDDTGQDMLFISILDGVFTFTVRKKS